MFNLLHIASMKKSFEIFKFFFDFKIDYNEKNFHVSNNFFKILIK